MPDFIPGSFEHLQSCADDFSKMAHDLKQAIRTSRLALLDIRNDDSELKMKFALDKITNVAASVFDTPRSVIMFIDDVSAFVKAETGEVFPAMPRDHSFCNMVVKANDIVAIGDSFVDPRSINNPNAGEVRFYVGAPILADDGFVLGALCVIDDHPRQDYNDKKIDTLRDLAALTGAILRK